MLIQKHSRELYKRGIKSLVGSVNSPVRSFKAVNTPMIFSRKGLGAYIWDVDRNKYIDYIMCWGVHILGHAYKPVACAAIAALKKSSSLGLTGENEIRLAEMIKRNFRSMDKVRFVSTGTEACMTALRLARAFTGRSKIIKFDGCYHGHFDSLLVKSGSGNLTFGLPSGAGVLPAYTRDTISLPFNDLGLFQEAIKKNKHQLACVIVEPVPCNMGVIIPREDFIKEISRITKQENIILIFDEVITGFRLSLSGAQGMFGVTPDLTCLGKIIGGGFPIAAVGGRKQIMDLLAPLGQVYQAGTFSGNPVSVAAGIKTLECLEVLPGFYKGIEKKTKDLVFLIRSAAEAQGIPLTINNAGSVFTVFFTDKSVCSFADTRQADQQSYGRFFSALLQQGVLFPPSAFEACFVSGAHSETVIERTAQAFKIALGKMRQG